MMKTLTVYIQDCIDREHVVLDKNSIIHHSSGYFDDLRIITFNKHDVPYHPIGSLLTFCSLQLANRFSLSSENLSNGLFYWPEKLFTHRYSQHLDRGVWLNEDCFYLPWGNIPQFIDVIFDTFGDKIFIRPDSPYKPFTGFDVTVDKIKEEHRSLGQICHIDKEELCLITSFKNISETEHRFWCVDGKVSTSAKYSWVDNLSETPSIEMLKLVKETAEKIAEYDDALVLDFVETDDGPKLVEINAISTSGFYKGMNFNKLCADLKELTI